MKIAVISDIHGNMQALDAVLEDIKKSGAQKILCLGDLAMAGPEPEKTINKIKELIEKQGLVCIQGNTDEMIAISNNMVYEALNRKIPVMAEAYNSDIKEISEENKEFLKILDKNKELKFGELRLLMVHGSPRKNDENISPNMPIKDVEKMIENTDADLILCGHTHLPCGYQTNTKQTVINVGSVGRPFSLEPKACYLLMTIDENKFVVEHRLVEYDFEKASKILTKRKFKGADKLAKMLISATSRYPQ